MLDSWKDVFALGLLNCSDPLTELGSVMIDTANFINTKQAAPTKNGSKTCFDGTTNFPS
jgi:hypothetical protein